MKITFNHWRLALIRRAHPGCNLDNLSEVTFEFDEAGNIIDCTGRLEDTTITHSHVGEGLVTLHAMAVRQREQLAAGTSATVLPLQSSQSRFQDTTSEASGTMFAVIGPTGERPNA
jgi:hypothetical protein